MEVLGLINFVTLFVEDGGICLPCICSHRLIGKVANQVLWVVNLYTSTRMSFHQWCSYFSFHPRSCVGENHDREKEMQG